MTPFDVREWILAHADLFPYKIRMEVGKKITWNHLDVDYEPHNPKIYFFKV